MVQTVVGIDCLRQGQRNFSSLGTGGVSHPSAWSVAVYWQPTSVISISFYCRISLCFLAVLDVIGLHHYRTTSDLSGVETKIVTET